MEPTTSEGLVRVMDTRALSLGIVNMIVGAGIFVLPGLLAGLLGPAAIIAYLICSVAVALVFLCFAEAGSRVTRSGGAYAYITDAFGPFAGFVASTLLWFGWGILSNAAVAIALVEVAVLAFPVLDATLPRSLFLVALFAGLSILNIRGVKAGVQFVSINTYLKLIPLVVLVLWGAFSMRWENLVIPGLPSLADLGAGTLILVFAFGGAEALGLGLLLAVTGTVYLLLRRSRFAPPLPPLVAGARIPLARKLNPRARRRSQKKPSHHRPGRCPGRPRPKQAAKPPGPAPLTAGTDSQSPYSPWPWQWPTDWPGWPRCTAVQTWPDPDCRWTRNAPG
jgi:Amino acid permease